MSTSQCDVFLCHNSRDKKAIDKIRELLQSRKITCFVDKHDLEPFQCFVKQLEEVIPQAKSAAIFLGSSGWGPYQLREIDLFTEKLAEHPNYRVGLVRLPGCPDDVSKFLEGKPSALKAYHWVDFYQENVDPIEKLIEGILGKRNKSKKGRLPHNLMVNEKENRKLRADLFDLVADEFKGEAERLLKIVDFERKRIQDLEREMNNLIPIIIQETKLDLKVAKDANFIRSYRENLAREACEYALRDTLQSKKEQRSREEDRMFRYFVTDIDDLLGRISVCLINSREILLEEKFDKQTEIDSKIYVKALKRVKYKIYKAEPNFTPLLEEYMSHLIRHFDLL